VSIEDDLFDMLKDLNLGGGTKIPFNILLGNLVNTSQINVLREFQGKLAQLQDETNKRIQELSKKSKGKAGALDPYTILGVRPDATQEQVEKAYRKKAATAHPDKGGSNEKMVLVNAAYEAIKRVKGWT